MINRRKQMLRDEWRKDPKFASQHMVEQKPAHVYRKKYDDIRPVTNEN